MFKYLTPEHVCIVEGFLAMESSITLQISDIAAVQLLDRPRIMNLTDKISSFDKVFLAPELIMANGALHATIKADIYSVGVILYFLVVKRFPFSKGYKNDSYSPNISLKFSEPEWHDYSAETRIFISKCLHPNPEIRPSIAELMQEVFLVDHAKDFLDKHCFKEGNIPDDQVNCFQLHTASVLHEIIMHFVDQQRNVKAKIVACKRGFLDIC